MGFNPFGFIVDLFKGVALTFNAIAKLIPDFPKLILCFIKLIFMTILRLFLMIPGVDVSITVVLNIFEYLLVCVLKVAVFVIYVIIACVMWFLDNVVGKSIKMPHNSFGLTFRKFIKLFSTCFNDPRVWYTVSRNHRNNRHTSIMGLSPCLSPCPGQYEPNFMFTCKRSERSTTAFCPDAAITRIADGLRYSPTLGYELNEASCDTRAESLTKNQKRLIRAACSQPDAFTNPYLKTMCYEKFCKSEPTDEGVAVMCAGIVPYKQKKLVNTNDIFKIPILMISGFFAFFHLVTTFKAKQNRYMQMHTDWSTENTRFNVERKLATR